MKRKIITTLSIFLAISPGAANAIAVDNFVISEGKRNFGVKDVTGFSKTVDGCGVLFVVAEKGRPIVKAAASQVHDRASSIDEISSDQKFTTHFDVSLGHMNKDGKFTEYKLDKKTLSAPYLPRYVELSEFPSNDPQLGGYLMQRLIREGFKLHFEGKEIGSTQTVSIEKGEIPKSIFSDFINCTNKISRQILQKWQESFPGKPPQCFYNPKLEDCKE